VDEAALIAVARTNPDAFARLYDRTMPGVYRFALSLTGDHARAEDVTAETFRKALATFDRYQDRGAPFASWLCAIARNIVRDGARKAGRETPLLDHDTPVDAWPGLDLVRAEEAAEVRALVARLTPVQRRVVVLRYGHDWSYRDVGERMGKSEAAVKQLAYRAVQNLRAWAREGER
jgi:RNA polymerase sigma-70 factor (ECF subfamily)